MSLPVAVQIYSVRKDAESDLYGTLKKIKDMGYEGVEFAGLYGHSGDEVRAMLDGGEDKLDTNIAYGDIADYVAFRYEQLEFIKNTNIDGEIKLVMCHVPFASFDTPFKEVFALWTEELNKKGIDLMLAGHKHGLFMFGKGESDVTGVAADFPVCVGSNINKKVDGTYAGTAILIGKDKIDLYFTDKDNRVLEEHEVSLKA